MTGQTAGQYADDSTITASVKAKLVGDKVANLTRVDVTTTNKVVSLNGVVESPDQKTRAEQLTKEVAGVSRVENHLQIQKKPTEVGFAPDTLWRRPVGQGITPTQAAAFSTCTGICRGLACSALGSCSIRTPLLSRAEIFS